MIVEINGEMDDLRGRSVDDSPRVKVERRRKDMDVNGVRNGYIMACINGSGHYNLNFLNRFWFKAEGRSGKKGERGD